MPKLCSVPAPFGRLSSSSLFHAQNVRCSGPCLDVFLYFYFLMPKIYAAPALVWTSFFIFTFLCPKSTLFWLYLDIFLLSPFLCPSSALLWLLFGRLSLVFLFYVQNLPCYGFCLDIFLLFPLSHPESALLWLLFGHFSSFSSFTSRICSVMASVWTFFFFFLFHIQNLLCYGSSFGCFLLFLLFTTQ